MGKILDHKKYVEVHISLEDIFKANGQAIKYALGSLSNFFIRKFTPSLAAEIDAEQLITEWAFENGEVIVYVGKQGYDEFEIIHEELV